MLPREPREQTNKENTKTADTKTGLSWYDDKSNGGPPSGVFTLSEPCTRGIAALTVRAIRGGNLKAKLLLLKVAEEAPLGGFNPRSEVG